MRCRMLLAACALVGSVMVADAQEFRSTLTGRVTDPSGLGIPNVKVVATKVDTQSHYSSVTGTEGFYAIPALAPGAYELTAEAPSFRKYVQSGITVGSNQRIAQNIQLTVGAMVDTVTVVADAPPLNTVSASLGQVITAREVENLPINGRAPMDLAVLGFGVVNTGNRDQNRPYENAGFSNFAMGGAAVGANDVTLDGVPNIGTVGTTGTRVAYSPPVDAVEEVKIETFNVDASQGGYGGGTVEITTKGGSNKLRGSASWFNQSPGLAATPFFVNASGGTQTKPNQKQNLYSGTLGGPVYLPKVLNGHDKVFFFATFEKQKTAEPTPVYGTVPTDAERHGDFSQLLALKAVTGKDYTLYDPSTATLVGGKVVRQAFPNNIIPAGRLNPIAVRFLNDYVALPNTPGNADGTNNYFQNSTTTNDYSAYSGRLDFNLSNANKLAIKYQQSSWRQGKEPIFGTLAFGSTTARDIFGAMIDDVHAFSSTLVGNFKLGFSRYRAFYLQPSDGFDPTALGFPSYIRDNSTHLMMPLFSISGFTSNSGGSYTDQPYNNYQFRTEFTKVAGAHTLKLGGEVQLMDFSNLDWSSSTGLYTFDSAWVKADSTSGGPQAGGGMAAFLLGLPTSGTYQISSPQKDDSFYYVAFLQDDLRLRPNLTLNLGLRWEYSTPTVESHNRMSNGFDPTAVNQVTAAATAAYAKSPLVPLPAPLPQASGFSFNPVGGLTFADDQHRSAYSVSKGAFSPRLGFNWAANSETAVRLGAGVFRSPYGVITPQQPGYTANSSMVVTENNYLTPTTTLSNPFPNGLQLPAGASNGVSTFLGQGITYVNPDLKNMYFLRWNLSIQRLLAKDLMIEVAYIGDHGYNLTNTYNAGALPAQYLSRSATRDQATIDALAKQVPNPFAGLLPGSTLNSAKTSVASLLNPYPQFNGTVNIQNMNTGSSSYHALLTGLQKRFGHGLQLFVNYSYSRLMQRNSYLNAGDPTLERRLSSDDRPHVLSLSSTYDLPFGKGRRLLGNASPVIDGIFGGWSLAVTFMYHPGAPLGWGNLIYYGGPLNFNSHVASPQTAFDTTQFNTDSKQQLANNFRTFPSAFNDARADSTNNWNLTLAKSFHIYRSAKLQFRAEAFNLTNTPIFGGPNMTATDSNFGRITSVTNTPRLIQFGGRLTF